MACEAFIPMRAPDTWKFLSVVLLTLCTTKQAPPPESSAGTTMAVRRAAVRAQERAHETVADPRAVFRRPS
jgi:hypothetical protein